MYDLYTVTIYPSVGRYMIPYTFKFKVDKEPCHRQSTGKNPQKTILSGTGTRQITITTPPSLTPHFSN